MQKTQTKQHISCTFLQGQGGQFVCRLSSVIWSEKTHVRVDLYQFHSLILSLIISVFISFSHFPPKLINLVFICFFSLYVIIQCLPNREQFWFVLSGLLYLLYSIGYSRRRAIWPVSHLFSCAIELSIRLLLLFVHFVLNSFPQRSIYLANNNNGVIFVGVGQPVVDRLVTDRIIVAGSKPGSRTIRPAISILKRRRWSTTRLACSTGLPPAPWKIAYWYSI